MSFDAFAPTVLARLCRPQSRVASRLTAAHRSRWTAAGASGNGHRTPWKRLTPAIGLALALAPPAHAAAVGAPWEAPLQTFLNSLTGPVAQMAGVAAVVIAGFGIAFSEGGSGLRRLVWVAAGLSIAFAATTFFLPLFGFGGGLAV